MGINMHKELEALGGVSAPESAFDEITNWAAKLFAPWYRNEVDEYLQESTDHYDLEQRIKNLARRGVI